MQAILDFNAPAKKGQCGEKKLLHILAKYDFQEVKKQNKNISYVAFLDGSYSNVLLSDENRGDKLTTQRQEIRKYLTRNPNNFWINTAGFAALFKN